MKKIVLILAVALSANLMIAQTSTSLKEKVDKKMEMYSKPLNLSSDQSAKLESILTKGIGEVDAIKSKRPTREEAETRKADIDAINSRMKKEIKAILTPEQIKKVEQIRNENKKKKSSGK